MSSFISVPPSWDSAWTLHNICVKNNKPSSQGWENEHQQRPCQHLALHHVSLQKPGCLIILLTRLSHHFHQAADASRCSLLSPLLHFKCDGEECPHLCSPLRLLSNNFRFLFHAVQLDLQENGRGEELKPRWACLLWMFSEVYLLLRYLQLSGETKPSGMFADIWTHLLTL